MKKQARNKFLILAAAVICIAVLLLAGLALKKNTYAFAGTAPQSVTEQSGLGLGINVVKAKQANDFTTGNSVLNPERIPEIPTSKVNLNKNESVTHSTADINDLLVGFKLNYNSGGEAGIFLGNLKSNLNATANINYQRNTYKYYNVLEHRITRYNAYLDNYRDSNTYSQYFSAGFLSDLASLGSNKNYYGFFDKYGTHIVGSANFGGRLTATYAFASNKIILNNDISFIIKNQVQFNSLKEGIEGNIVSGIESYFNVDYAISDLQTDFSVQAIGGDAFASGTIQHFNDGYPIWAQSFNNDDGNSVIMEYASDGLVPLWDILPAPYSTTLKTSMKNAFKEYYNSFKNEIISEFKTSNTTAFAGGSGSESDPFLIGSEQQLKNIESTSMNANYKLNADISLSSSEWASIGGNYLTYKAGEKAAFNGSLDGNGYSIYNLRRTANIKEVNNRFYFGLFGYIGPSGTVKNLTFRNVAIHLTGPNVNNSKTRGFVGALAGVVRGTVENVKVFGECFYSICTNGSVFVGGIAGSAYGANIVNCKNSSAVTAGRYTSAAGGMVAYSVGSNFRNCINYRSILSRCTGYGGYARAGGIVGLKYNGTNGQMTNIESCINFGSYSSNSYNDIKINRHVSEGDLCAAETSDIYDKFA